MAQVPCKTVQPGPLDDGATATTTDQGTPEDSYFSDFDGDNSVNEGKGWGGGGGCGCMATHRP